MRTSTRILSAWGVAMLVVAAGCGALEEANGQGGQDGGASADAHPAGEDCSCVLSISPLLPTPGTILAAEVSPTGGVGPYTFYWTVTYAGGVDVPVSLRNQDGTQVDIPVDNPGSYTIEVVQTTGRGYACRAVKSVLVKNLTGKNDQVLVRFIPPASSGIPVQQHKFSITGGTPQGDLNFTLETGIPLDLPVTDLAGHTAPVFVRLVANAKGFETEAYLAAGAPVQLTVLDDSYDLLVIPDERGPKQFAPTLTVNQALSIFTQPYAQVTLDPGVVVSGNVTAAGGTAVEGARVMLTRGRLPSTVGVVDASGGFSVRVQSGAGFGVSVAPPESSGLPDLELPDGVTVATVGADLAVAYDASILPIHDLSAEVRSHTAAQVVAGARVTLRGQISTAGTVTVGTSTLPAPGVVRRVATTGANGIVSFPGLPAGNYDLVVEPLGHGLSDDATTRATVTLPVSPGPVAVPLFRKVTLSGTLQRPADLVGRPIAGTTVKAILRVSEAAPATLGAAPATAADAVGAFGVRVDPVNATAAVEYALVADPPSASGMARAMRVIRVDSLDDVAPTPLPLPRGLLLAGVVTPEFGAPVAGVFVQAYRYRAADQEDPAARAEAVTDAEGRFSLIFCDPDDVE
jgi:hypothetical protein